MADEKQEGGFVGYLWDTVKGFFVVQWEGFYTKLYELWPELIDKGFQIGKTNTKAADDILWDSFLEMMEKSGFMNKEQLEFFEPFKDLPAFSSLVMLALIAPSSIGLNIKAMLGATALTIEQQNFNAQRPNLADPGSLIKSAFIAPEKTAKIREFLGKHGFSDEQMDYLFLSNYALYDSFTCRDLFLRGILNKDQLFERMRELGFTDTRTKEMMQSWEVIPGPSDLFHLVAKEAFEPDMIQKMGLDDEFPESQVQWLEKQGLSEEWAKKYWYAHWEMPSIQMGFDMLHRGVIDENGLDMLFRSVEIPPFWRDKLTKITYLPYTRVDTRRMFNFGVLGVQDVYDSYTALGYDHDHALKMTEWTVAQKDPINKDISMGQILSTFEDQVLERSDAKALLQDIGYTESKAEFLITAREFEIAQKTEKQQTDIIKTRFVNRYVDKFETLRQLSLLNLPYKQQQLLMEQWELELMQDNKLPSKTDLEKFFLQSIISTDQYNQEMEKLGYNKEYISWFRKVLEIKKGVTEDV